MLAPSNWIANVKKKRKKKKKEKKNRRAGSLHVHGKLGLDETKEIRNQTQ